jgi:hypothetical protein
LPARLRGLTFFLAGLSTTAPLTARRLYAMVLSYRNKHSALIIQVKVLSSSVEFASTEIRLQQLMQM